jgi:hypothetical protein
MHVCGLAWGVEVLELCLEMGILAPLLLTWMNSLRSTLISSIRILKLCWSHSTWNPLVVQIWHARCYPVRMIFTLFINLYIKFSGTSNLFFLSVIEWIRRRNIFRESLLMMLLLLLLMWAHNLAKSLRELRGALDSSSLEVNKGRVPVGMMELAMPQLIKVLMALLMKVVKFWVNNLNTLPIR